jgi:hypothetical protein
LANQSFLLSSSFFPLSKKNVNTVESRYVKLS